MSSTVCKAVVGRNSGSTHTRSDLPQELKELIASYQTLRESGRGPAICNTIIETARQCNLDKDIKLPEGDAKDLDLAQRDSLVGQAYSRYHLIIPRYRPLVPFNERKESC